MTTETNVKTDEREDCPDCNGIGEQQITGWDHVTANPKIIRWDCKRCKGMGNKEL